MTDEQELQRRAASKIATAIAHEMERHVEAGKSDIRLVRPISGLMQIMRERLLGLLTRRLTELDSLLATTARPPEGTLEVRAGRLGAGSRTCVSPS
jgi:hypothetical protein